MIERYKQSNECLTRAEKSIPLGSQTFSKSKVCYPQGASPFFIQKGAGANVWDIDGNKYIDFVNGLLSVSLGYCDTDVDQAVFQQMQQGVTFSLPHKLEMEVAELLIDLIPCAEMVRFGKNGSDATSAAIRLARAYTGKEHIAVCGYHGWQDWYIGSTTRNLGVPSAVRTLTHTFKYNDLDSLQKIITDNPQKLAAVILEPMNLYYPDKNFLKAVQLLCKNEGILLIFDETITGFRFSIGGAQKLFGVTPDLATFGKGMSNGYPLSAVVGKKKVMKMMEDIFFSGTFSGETLSLAATKAVLTKLKTHNVIEHLHTIGKQLIDGLNDIIISLDSPKWLSLTGHPTWSFLLIHDSIHYDSLTLKSLFLQEMLKNGILINGSHNLSFSHTKEDIETLLNTYKIVLPFIAQVIEKKNLEDVLEGSIIKPVFKVR